MPSPESVDVLLSHERVRAARAHIERSDELTLARQAALSAIPAPTGAEAARGAGVAEIFDEIGLGDLQIDQAGKVLGWLLNGTSGNAVGASVVLRAHLDTGFAADLDV